VWLIKKILHGGGILQRDIAAMFGVDRATISYIKTGKTWKEILYAPGIG